MPDVHSSPGKSESQDFSSLIRVAADRLAVEKACLLIDSYIQEKQQCAAAFDAAQLRWPVSERAH
jgi:hypothetical protein